MATKAKLSKGILEMKFMKRTKEKVDAENEAAESRVMYSSEITDRMKKSKSNFIIEPSFLHCEELIEGRLSFRGMNPEIERILELEQAEKEEQDPKKAEIKKEVTDEEMTEYYGNVVKTMAKKFDNFKKPTAENASGTSTHVSNSRKRKFMKPQDD